MDVLKPAMQIELKAHCIKFVEMSKHASMQLDEQQFNNSV